MLKNEESTLQEPDFISIVRFFHTISNESLLDNLLGKIMQYVVECTGAEKGVIIENKEDHLIIQAIGNAQGRIQVLPAIPVEISTDLPLGVVNDVERTLETIVLENASQSASYAHDPYIQSNHILSVLCFPIIRKEKLYGIFYLENNLLPGLFSAEKIELLHIVSTPIALSLENAWLNEKRGESDKIREVENGKSLFFANISHKFRTPLTLILGLVRKIKEENLPEDEKQKQCAEVVSNAERLLQLINQLLDLSKLEAESMRLKVADYPVRKSLEGILALLVPLAFQYHINFRYRLPHKEIRGHLDADKLEIILTNLLGNAFKFTPDNGQVRLEAKIIGQDHDWLQMRIKDTGPGIPQKEIEHIFERLYPSGTSPEHGISGSGLGLTLTKALVERHKGKITVGSKLGKGTLFSVYLPIGRTYYNPSEMEEIKETAQLNKPIRYPNQKQQKTTNIQGPPAKGRKQILVVEDHQNMRHFIAGILIQNFLVAEAKDGKEGFKKAVEGLPDLIISDLMVPKMNGCLLCQKLKNDLRTCHIPVILLTAKADLPTRIKGLEAGADDCLTKPFSERELLARVNNLIRQRERLKEIFAQNLQISPQTLVFDSQDQRFLQKVLETIEAQLPNPQFGVEDFCREIGMSRSQFYRKLHALTGFSANEFLREMRLKRAAALIESHLGSITEIALESGFNNLSYFSKCFQHRFGQSPKSYSKQFPLS